MIQHFYFFRHGQTNENEAGKKYGTTEESWLTPTGEKQAKKLGMFLSDKNIQVVYSSPLKRAVNTAKIAINNPKIKIITDERLIEAAFGFWYAQDDEKQKHIMNNFYRIKSCLDDIIANDKHENIAIASHGGVTRALCYACGVEIGGIKNCQCFHFVLDNGSWKFIEEFETGIEVQNKSDMPKERNNK